MLFKTSYVNPPWKLSKRCIGLICWSLVKCWRVLVPPPWLLVSSWCSINDSPDSPCTTAAVAHSSLLWTWNSVETHVIYKTCTLYVLAIFNSHRTIEVYLKNYPFAGSYQIIDYIYSLYCCCVECCSLSGTDFLHERSVMFPP